MTGGKDKKYNKASGQDLAVIKKQGNRRTAFKSACK